MFSPFHLFVLAIILLLLFGRSLVVPPGWDRLRPLDPARRHFLLPNEFARYIPWRISPVDYGRKRMNYFTERRILAVVRWTARILGGLLLALIATLAIGEGVPNPTLMSLRENLLGIAFQAMIIGQIVAWKWKGIGSFLILGGFALFAVVNPGFRGMWLVPAPWLATGLLYLVCWWRRTKIAAG
jgi:hypothetical protein